MRRIVFVGPTLSGDAQFREIFYRPPAKCGDIARAVEDGFDAIGLVDGFFESVRSVWHKELLWALSQRVAVIGASSMGALRAAEMHSFGMVGVGRVFRLFESGKLTDDDEVAVAHAPAELNYIPTTDAMVNIRFTLDKAVRQRILRADIAKSLAGLAKGRFFKERSFDVMISDGIECGLDRERLILFKKWLFSNAVDVKRSDARLLLRTLAIIRPPAGKAPKFIGSRHWDRFAAEMRLRGRSS